MCWSQRISPLALTSAPALTATAQRTRTTFGSGVAVASLRYDRPSRKGLLPPACRRVWIRRFARHDVSQRPRALRPDRRVAPRIAGYVDREPSGALLRLLCHMSLATALAMQGCTDTAAPRPFGPLSLVTAYRFTSRSANDFITDFAFAGDGAMWVTTFENRLIRVSGGEIREVAVPLSTPSAPRPQIHDLFVDPRGRPWIAVGSRIVLYNGTQWLDQGPPDLMGIHPVSGQLAVNAVGDIAFSLGDVETGGLLLRTNGVWSVQTPENSRLPSPITSQVGVAEDGAFWVASSQWRGLGGLTRMLGGQITRVFTKDDVLLYNQVDDVIVRASNLWIAYKALIYDRADVAEGGIQRVSLTTGNIDSYFPATTGLSSNRVSRILLSSAGELWFATTIDHHPAECQTCFAALGVMNPAGTMRVISTLNSNVAPNENFSAIREAPDGSIYVARANRMEIARVLDR